MSLVRDLLALVGAAVLAWNFASCLRSYFDKAPPRVTRRPAWDARDRQVYFRNMERRK